MTAVLLAGLSGSAVAEGRSPCLVLYPIAQGGLIREGRSVGLLAPGVLLLCSFRPSLPLILVGVAGNKSINTCVMGGIVQA